MNKDIYDELRGDKRRSHNLWALYLSILEQMPEAMRTLEWLQAVQECKQAHFEGHALEEAQIASLPSPEAEALRQEKHARIEALEDKKVYERASMKNNQPGPPVDS